MVGRRKRLPHFLPTGFYWQWFLLSRTLRRKFVNLIRPCIERVAMEELQATQTPGAAVAVVSGDQVIFSHGYGVASVETGAPLTPDMLFRLGSTTKMFTASAVVGLALEGKIDLNAPVSRYISGLDPAIGQLTANQLLSHTSGLHDEAPMFGSHDETALGTASMAGKRISCSLRRAGFIRTRIPDFGWRAIWPRQSAGSLTRT